MKKAIVIAGLVIAALYTIGHVSEISSVSNDTETYRHLYGLSKGEPHWQFQSAANFKLWHWALAAYNIGYIILCCLFLKRKKQALFNVIVAIDIIVVALFIRSLVLLIQSGFDHYPGYDPYIF